MKNLFKNHFFLCGLYLLIRMLLAPLSPIPGAVALDPLWVFMVLGPATPARIKVPAMLPGLIAGDLMAALPWPVIACRAVGLVVLSLVRSEGGPHRRFLFWMVHHALWSAVMSDWLGNYPVGYLYMVWVLQGVLWWGITAPKQGMGRMRPLPPLLGIPAGLLLLHLIFDAPDLWPLPRLGAQSSRGILIGSAFFLLTSLISCLFSLKQGARTSSIKGSRWSNLAD